MKYLATKFIRMSHHRELLDFANLNSFTNGIITHWELKLLPCKIHQDATKQPYPRPDSNSPTRVRCVEHHLGLYGPTWATSEPWWLQHPTNWNHQPACCQKAYVVLVSTSTNTVGWIWPLRPALSSWEHSCYGVLHCSCRSSHIQRLEPRVSWVSCGTNSWQSQVSVSWWV